MTTRFSLIQLSQPIAGRNEQDLRLSLQIGWISGGLYRLHTTSYRQPFGGSANFEHSA